MVGSSKEINQDKGTRKGLRNWQHLLAQTPKKHANGRKRVYQPTGPLPATKIHQPANPISNNISKHHPPPPFLETWLLGRRELWASTVNPLDPMPLPHLESSEYPYFLGAKSRSSAWNLSQQGGWRGWTYTGCLPTRHTHRQNQINRQVWPPLHTHIHTPRAS